MKTNHVPSTLSKKRTSGSRCLKAKSIAALALSMALMLPQTITAHESTLQDSDALYHEISYEDELAEAAKSINLGDTSHVTSNLILPLSYGIHVNIDWKSSDESVIDSAGTLTTPTDADKDVTLTATVTSTKTDATETKEFHIHVPKATVEDVLNQDAKTAQEYIDYILNTGYVLPDSKELGIRSEVTWELLSGKAAIENGTLVKTPDSAERQPVTLKATLTFENKEKTVEVKNLVLLDEYAGYILSYFAGKEESKEMYLGYSYDGIQWMRLNYADAVLTPTMGNRQIRDPFIMRKKDGSFAIFATNGWTSNMITIWDSEDLLTYENERLCELSHKGGLASGFHTWAPECNYDPITNQYFVYWSDPEGNRDVGVTYYNTSTDLLNFSKYDVFYEGPFSLIDASIKKYKGDYYLVHNDSTGDNDTGKGGRRIYAAKADSLEAGAFHPYTGSLSEAVAEGPFLLQNFKSGEWFVYYDYYQKHKFGITKAKDLASDEWEYMGINETMPWDEVRHGGAIPVTQKELDKILDKWCLEDPEVNSIPDINIHADADDEVSDLNLPKTVSATLADGNIVDIPVNWNTDGISLEAGKIITIDGSLEKSNISYNNDSNLLAKATITINKNSNLVVYIIIGGVILILVTIGFVLKKKKNS